MTRTIPSDDQHWAQVEEAFAAALDTPSDAREALLASLCSDSSVHDEVRRLLARHDALSVSPHSPTGFLDGLDRARAAELLDTREDPATIGRYEVMGRVGRGASGVVYLARDPSLGRRVALKLLAPHLSRRPDAVRRFAEEARLASALDHPHIAMIHEIGHTDDGRIFLTMPYYEGETLRLRLARGPLPVKEAVQLASQLADALGAAHAQGIVHRDVKPENVVLTARGPRLLDFGIAVMTGQVGRQTDVPVGTVAYMSPEQTHGAHVGPQADIWALGIVFYEMLAGVRPFHSETTDGLFASIRGAIPPPLASLRRDVPDAVVRIVERCMEKNPHARYDSVDRLLADLPASAATRTLGRRRIAVAAFLLALGSVGALAARARIANQLAAAAEPALGTIAVLPFADSSPASGDAYISQGMTDAVVDALGGLAGVRVAARPSVDWARRRDSNPTAIGKRVGVASVLRGSVAREGNRVRVNAQLLSTADGQALWSETFVRGADDVLSLQDEVGRALVAALQARIGGGAGSAASHMPTADRLAYDFYLQGRFRMQRRTPADLEQAAILFREALASDSSFAGAYVGLAEVYMAVQDAKPADRYERARPLLARALALDSTLAAGHKAAGWIAMWYDRDWAAAERHYQRALALDPSDVGAHHGYAALLSATGRTKESLAMTRSAVVLDPVGVYTTMHIGLHLYWDGQYEEAIAVLRRALEADSSFGRAHAVLGRALLAVGRYEEAITELRRGRNSYAALEPSALLAYALGTAGHAEEARTILAQYEARARATYVSPVNLIAIHLGLGQVDRALDWLEKVPDDRGVMIFPLSDPMFDVLHGMPRYERVLVRLNLNDPSILRK